MTTKKDLIAFYHGACFSPTKTTLLTAIKNGNFLTWPGFTYGAVSKYLIPTIATAFGQLHQERQNLQSTKPSVDADYFPAATPKNEPTNQHFVQMSTFQRTHKAYRDLTGRFPYTSTRENQYFLIVYDYDSNAILVQLLKNRSGLEIKKAYMDIYDKLANRGCAPTTLILDNEISKELTSAFENKQINYQLVPPEVHRHNATECAIQTWKNHFISGLSSVNPSFPMVEWDQLVRQGEIILNLLMNSRVNPKLLAWTYLFGHFDFNATPQAPPGTKMVVHVKPHKRGS